MTISPQALNQVRSIIRELDQRIASARQQRKSDATDTARDNGHDRSGQHEPDGPRGRAGLTTEHNAP